MRPADVETAVELNCRFHRAITRAAGSPKIIRIVQSTIRFIPERYYALLPAWKQVASDGHRTIIEAIERGDVEGARAAAAGHVHEAGSLLIEYFDDSGFWAEPGAMASATDSALTSRPAQAHAATPA
jgi:DNA-binding GntR family transcriptional regulator